VLIEVCDKAPPDLLKCHVVTAGWQKRIEVVLLPDSQLSRPQSGQ
jgi:hypothetical protein